MKKIISNSEEETKLIGRKFAKDLKKGDVIVLAGKGHEDYQIVMGDTYYFDDKECAKEYIKKKEKGSNV